MLTSKTTQLQAWGIALLRIATGIVFLGAGVRKLFLEGLFLQGFSDPYAGGYLPNSTVVVGSSVELFCGAALVVGLLTRWVCVPLALLMLADILVMHPPSGFFVGDEGFEHAFLRLAASAAIVVAGPGKVALDNGLAIRREQKKVTGEDEAFVTAFFRYMKESYIGFFVLALVSFGVCVLVGACIGLLLGE